jgi:hypothetical protein
LWQKALGNVSADDLVGEAVPLLAIVHAEMLMVRAALY